MWKYLVWTGKGHGSSQLVLMTLFILVDFYLRLKVRYLKIELKIIVGGLFCDLTAWSPYTGNGNAEIGIAET